MKQNGLSLFFQKILDVSLDKEITKADQALNIMYWYMAAKNLEIGTLNEWCGSSFLKWVDEHYQNNNILKVSDVLGYLDAQYQEMKEIDNLISEINQSEG